MRSDCPIMEQTNTIILNNVSIGDEEDVKITILMEICQIMHEYTINKTKCSTICKINHFIKQANKYILSYVEHKHYDNQNEKNSEIQLGCIYNYVIDKNEWKGTYIIPTNKLNHCSTNSARNTQVIIRSRIPTMKQLSKCMHFFCLCLLKVLNCHLQSTILSIFTFQ